MAVIIGLSLLFVVLLILPFVVSVLSIRKSREASLYVKNDNVRDPRYFSNSFRTLVEKGINPQNRTIQMSKLEPFLYADEVNTNNACNAIVVAENRFRPLGVPFFCKEIYAASSAHIPPNTYLRAIACLGELELSENCAVIRWADSEKQMTVGPGCSLGMNASSSLRLVIAPGCTFRRLYAPEILIGTAADDMVRYPVDMTVVYEKLIDIREGRPQRGHRKDDRNGVYSLEIGEGAVIMGSVKSTASYLYSCRRPHQRQRDRRRHDHRGRRARAYSARRFRRIPSWSARLREIGVKPKLKSLIARKYIVLCETAKVFGYVGCEVDSVTIPKDAISAGAAPEALGFNRMKLRGGADDRRKVPKRKIPSRQSAG